MDFNSTVANAANGDLDAFKELYAAVYADLYHIAFFSLRNDADAQSAVREATRICFCHCGECKNETSFKAYFIRLLCEQIIAFFKRYREEGVSVHYDENALTPDKNGVDMKQEFNRLTDAQRLTVSVWTVCGYSVRQISIVTGLKEADVEAKLQSGREKLTANLASMISI